MYLGLDKDECLNDPLVKEQGYTPDILKRLIAECKILSTQDIVDFSENFVLRDAFKQHYFALDYEKDYKASTLNFWRNINSMSHSLIPVLEDMLVKIYPDLAGEEMSPKRIQLAGLVLSNAYNAYLLNHATDGSKKAYAYEHHDESVIAVTWSENGPFDRARAFSVHPNDPQLSGSMDLMKELIRKNRLGGRMSETEKHAVAQMYHRPADYVKNPVPVMLFERLDTTPSQELIDRMREVDWSDLADTNWMTMSDEQFEGYLDSKLPHIPASVVRKINTMRMRAIKAHKPGLPATEAFLDGRLVPIWLLTDQNRSTIAMFPFITKGYDEDATVN